MEALLSAAGMHLGECEAVINTASTQERSDIYYLQQARIAPEFFFSKALLWKPGQWKEGVVLWAIHIHIGLDPFLSMLIKEQVLSRLRLWS